MTGLDKPLPAELSRLFASPIKDDRRKAILEVMSRRYRTGITVLERLAATDPENDLRVMAFKAANLLHEQFLDKDVTMTNPQERNPVHDLEDPVATRRNEAVVQLGRSGFPESLSPLMSLAARETDPMVKSSLARALAKCADLRHRDQVLSILGRTLLSDPDPRTRAAALDGLGIMDGREMGERVLARILDEDLVCKAAAAELVKKWGLDSLLTTARSMLLGPNVQARRAAVDALAIFPRREVVSLLAWTLADPDKELAAKARRILERMAENGQMAAVDALRRAQESSNRAPATPEDQAGSTVATNKLEDPAPLFRLQEIRRIVCEKDHTKIPALIGRLAREDDTFVVSAIVNALGQLGTANALAAVGPHLGSSDSRVRANAVEAIGRLGNPADRAALARFLKDENNRVRANAIVACHGLPGLDVKPVLIEMLAADDVWMRKSALYAIHTLNDPELTKLLKPSERPGAPRVS